MAAPAWKPDVPAPSRQPARAGFLPYGIPHLGQVACQAADRRSPPHIGVSATIKLPHSHLIFITPGDLTALRLAEEGAGACKFLAETGERRGRGSFSGMPFSPNFARF
jgi:hypothetical protein